MRCEPSGSPQAELMIVGEGLGRQEMLSGRPFVGESGKMLWAALQEGGVDRADAYVTNVNMSGASVKAADLAAERPRLEAELLGSAARVLFLLGGVSFKAVTGLTFKGVTGLTSLTDMRGYVLRPEDFHSLLRRQMVQTGVYKTSRAGKYQKGDPKLAPRRLPFPRPLPPNVETIIATVHPSHIMRQEWETLPALRADAARVGRALRGELDLIDARTLDYSPEPIDLEGDVVAVDIETEGISNVISCVGASDSVRTWSAPWSADARHVVSQLFAASKRTLVFHNAAFDLPRLELAGVPSLKARLWDSMWAAQLLAPALPKGLARTATLALDLRPWKHMSEEDLGRYNAADAYITARLALCQMAML